MHDLIASPFLEQHVLLQPGRQMENRQLELLLHLEAALLRLPGVLHERHDGLLLPEGHYEELRTHNPDEPGPGWLADTVRRQWGLDVTGRPLSNILLVRQPSTWGYGRASWEINLGCNYQCIH
ncbi:hypothetical protein ACIBCO_40215 [Streptomyces violascens]|uniref:hypothetical protein n=1 Tax=Streptomyces violascens TaxID=67381 RepID=UPI0037A7DC87